MVKRRFHHHVFVKSQPKKRKQLKSERPAFALQRNLLKVLVFLYKRLGKMRWISKIILQYLKCVNHAARLGKNQIWLDSTHFFLKWHMRALNYNWNIRLFFRSAEHDQFSSSGFSPNLESFGYAMLLEWKFRPRHVIPSWCTTDIHTFSHMNASCCMQRQNHWAGYASDALAFASK